MFLLCIHIIELVKVFNLNYIKIMDQPMNKKNRRGGMVLGMLLGGIVGTVTGLLMAPRPGKETRAILRRKGNEWGNGLRKRLKKRQQKGQQ